MDRLSSQRSLFCYRCGQPNTVAPKCPRCKSENLCPDLEQSLYLGIDSWKAFHLAPDVLEVNELDIAKIQAKYADDNEFKKKNIILVPIKRKNLIE